jgi:hypothetical protein
LCGVAQAARLSLHHPPRQGAAGACPTSALGHDPRSPWAEPAGSPRSTSRWPQPPGPVRAAAADLLEPRRLDEALPTAVWPSRAALPPASDRGSRPARGRPSTAARCARGAARQNAAHGCVRGGRLERPAAPRRLPSRPKTPRAATGRLARDGAARWRGGPGASRRWSAPCPCVAGGGPARRGRVCVPALTTPGGPPAAPYRGRERGRQSVASLRPGAGGGEPPDRSPALRRPPAARWSAGAGASARRLRSARSARPVRGGRVWPAAASRPSPGAPRCPGAWPGTPAPLRTRRAGSHSPVAVGGRRRRGHRPPDESPPTGGRARPVPPGRVAPKPPATVPRATCHRREPPRHAGLPPRPAPARPALGSRLLGSGAGDR